jgi:hypothetical protein
MSRVPDWQVALAECVAARALVPFAWGAQDCALFAADCAQVCTGHDPAAGLRGTYHDALGAARVLAQFGGLAAIAAERFGEEVPVLFAQPGDIGLIETEGRDSLCVWTGGAWHAPGKDGLVAFTLDRAKKVWRLEKEV